MFSSWLFWIGATLSLFFRVRPVKPEVIYFLSGFPSVPYDEPSQRALRFIRETLQPKCLAHMNGILVSISPWHIGQVQATFDQLCQRGRGYWTYPAVDNEIIFWIPSPGQWKVAKFYQGLQDRCLKWCWETKRCVIPLRQFRKLVAEEDTAPALKTFPNGSVATFLYYVHLRNVRPRFDPRVYKERGLEVPDWYRPRPSI